MRAGSLRRLIVIESNTTTVNAVGEAVSGWATYRTAWARVESQGGREFQAAQQQVATLTHLITVRYHPSKVITAGMRVKIGTRTMDIVAAADPTDAKRTQSLLCVERAA